MYHWLDQPVLFYHLVDGFGKNERSSLRCFCNNFKSSTGGTELRVPKLE
ncbi:hypothetical protein KP77_27910 [Jeotgalibacillus alimentarius]|uniref:Uncharacterized protein n=1 Tax=Jeotgalibacillus alimentarius TaxID=135826 RepID=A0A0C2RY06_9BACL|nr:hypothetical protein KP77_27910 [Jeotgalibacillus alimentarius]